MDKLVNKKLWYKKTKNNYKYVVYYSRNFKKKC